MARFMSRQNLTLQGREIRVGEVADLDDDPDVRLLVDAQMLIRANSDGTFSDPPPAPAVSCCGTSR